MHRAQPLPAERQFVRPAHWVAPQGRPAWRARGTALLAFEDAAGTCNTCPGELDSAESCFQRDPSPPSVPWRVLGAGLAVLICVPLVLHLAMVLIPAALQVAAR